MAIKHKGTQKKRVAEGLKFSFDNRINFGKDKAIRKRRACAEYIYPNHDIG